MNSISQKKKDKEKSIVIMTKSVFQTPASSNSNRRPQGAARNLQYSQRTTQGPPIANVNGISIDSFRLLSVLGRGHFGKVILSQYKKSGKNHLSNNRLNKNSENNNNNCNIVFRFR